MKNEVSNRELELLSAYMDQELNSKEKELIEARLKSNPDLRQILGELHQNRAAMRGLPRLRAPRNFTLSPEVAGVKPKRLVYPAFGLVSALSSLVLILVLVGDFLVQPSMISQPVVEQPAAQVVAVEETSEVEMLREAEIIITAQEEAAEEPMQAAQAESVVETEDVVMESEGLEGTQVEGTPLDVDIFSSKIPQPTATLSAQVDTAAPSLTPTAVQPTQTPTPSFPTVTFEPTITEVGDSGMTATPITIESQTEAPGPPVIRILEISLAAVALLTGSVALFLRSRTQ